MKGNARLVSGEIESAFGRYKVCCRERHDKMRVARC